MAARTTTRYYLTTKLEVEMLYGADTQQLAAWALKAQRCSEPLTFQTSTKLTSFSDISWAGPDAEDFHARLGEVRSHMDMAAAALHHTAGEAKSHADEQSAASSEDEIADSGGAPPQGRDQEGNPTGNPGDYIPYLPEDDGWDRKSGENAAEQWIDPDMVEQGAVGDCGAIATLMALAQHNPDLIRRNLRRNDDGTWTVTLYKDGEPVDITVDSTLPINGSHSLIPADLDGDGVEDEYIRQFSWVSIYEKALAEFTSKYGDSSYAELNNGGYGDEYMEILTGQEARRTGASSFEDLSARLSEGPVTVTTELPPDEWWKFTPEVNDPTIVPNHEYNVHGFIPAGTPAPDGSVSDQDRIHLDNPWGPDGGDDKAGDLYLTEQEYKDNFRAASSVPTS